MSYTFEITDKDGNCTEYKNIQKACYTIPVPNAKETVVEGDDLFIDTKLHTIYISIRRQRHILLPKETFQSLR